MELLDFLKALRRRKTLLILVPLVTVLVSYIIVSNLPDKYISHSRIATGLADKSLQLGEDGSSHDSKVNQEFGNILQLITLNKIVDQVSYKLLLHDLSGAKPFRKLAKPVNGLDENSRGQLVAILKAKEEKKEPLSLGNSSEQKVHKALTSMKYDNESLKDKLKVFRVENSDFINMDFESDNPQLSAFVLNTLSDEFIHYYTNVISENKKRTVAFLDSQLKEKQAALLASTEELKTFRMQNGLINMEEQSRSLYTQMTDIATRRGLAQKDVVAYNAALRGIDNHFDPKDRTYMESSAAGINQEIVQTKEHLKDLNDAYVKSDFDPRYKSQIDSAQRQLTAKIYEQNDKYATNPLAAKENLVNQRINLEVSRDLAKNSVASLNNEIGRINQGLNKIAPGVANIQTYEARVEIANKEYVEVLQLYNQASLDANYILPIRQIEKAMPENAQPGKKPLLVALSGVMSLVLCVLVLFGIYYFDRSVYSPAELEAATGLPVLGTLNVVHGNHLDLKHLWTEQPGEADKHIYKNMLRSLRYEIEKTTGDNKMIAITSLKGGAGKTFLTTSLAYAFSKLNKKVLIIDGNFMNPEISNSIQKPKYLESYLLGTGPGTNENVPMSILGNKGGDYSLLELGDQQTLERIFEQLRARYDIILIETGAIESVNKAMAKEWILFADKVIAVHEAGQPLDGTMDADLKYLQDLGDKCFGFVLNKVPGLHTDRLSQKSAYNKTKSRLAGLNLSKRSKLKPVA